jgi:hypothetical protein
MIHILIVSRLVAMVELLKAQGTPLGAESVVNLGLSIH